MMGVATAAEITEATLRESEVPAAVEDAQDALGEGPIALACMRGAPTEHVIYEFLIPLIAAENPEDEDWADPDWRALFARGIADRLVCLRAPPELSAAEALVDAIGEVGDVECARAVLPCGSTARDALRRARRYTGSDRELLCAADGAVLARIQLVPMAPGLAFPEFATLEWTVVVDSVLVPVLVAGGMDERAATRALVGRMLEADEPMTIRRAWLEALDDEDVEAHAGVLTSLVSILPRRLLPALVASSYADDAAVGAHVRAILLDVASARLDVAPATLETLLARLPSAMLDVALEARAHETAARAAASVRELRADLVPAALGACAACRRTCAAGCVLFALARALVRATFARCRADELVGPVIRGGLVAELALVVDAAAFARMCGALGHARLATLLASLDRVEGAAGLSGLEGLAAARAEIERRLFSALRWQ
jgi:hypothetical protein